MEPRGKPGSFSAYLKSGQRQEQERAQSTPMGTPLDLLHLLADAPNREMQMERISAVSRMNASTLHRNLKELLDSGFVSIQGPTLEETVSLTEAGARVVSLAR